MSWLADIAGKAENFLNKVDQGAASALQKDNLKKAFNGSYSEIIPTGNSHIVDLNDHGSELVTKSSPLPEKKNSFNQKAIVKTNIKQKVGTPKDKNKEDDEKLLEYLNGAKEVNDLKKKNSLAVNAGKVNRFKSKSDDGGQIKHEKHDVGMKMVISSDTSSGGLEKSKSHDRLAHIDEINRKSDESSTEEMPPRKISNKSDGDDGNSVLTTLEFENKLLKKEMVSLNEEVALALKRASNSEKELMAIKKKLTSQSNQLTRLEKLLQESQGKEDDFMEAMKAKDSQIAVLRVRIEERDQELKAKLTAQETLQAQNDRLLKDHSDTSGLQSQALDSLKLKLSDAEHALRLERESLKAANQEAAMRLNKLEEEKQNMVIAFTSSERQLTELKGKHSEISEKYSEAKHSHNLAVTELNEYKQKAQRILQSKDKMISSLQEASSGNSENGGSNFSTAIVELEELRHERDTLREELNQAVAKISSLQMEVSEVENSMQNEMDVLQKQVVMFEEKSAQDEINLKDIKDENSQLKTDLRFLRDDMSKMKNGLQSRIQDRDLEIEKLRKQVTARNISNSTETELEARVHSLTESLIQKQTILETMSTEKNSLILQLERLENEMKESRTYSRQGHSVIGINEADEVKARVPVFLRESPFDGQITRKVKRVYNSIDIFSVRAGIFLRQYPVARVFILVYMLLLHLWVLIVLMTYTPESHSPDNSPHPAPKI